MLLLDENLSPKLASKLKELFSSADNPDVKHVLHVGLDNAEDSRQLPINRTGKNFKKIKPKSWIF